MSGKQHMLVVAAVHFAIGAVGIVSTLILLVTGAPPRLGAAATSVVCIFGAYYFLNGSTWAKNFLVVMSVIGVVLSLPLIPFFMQAPGVTFLILLFILTGIGLAYCCYALIFSTSLKREFDQRAASYRAKQEKDRQRFYEEFEGSKGE